MSVEGHLLPRRAKQVLIGFGVFAVSILLTTLFWGPLWVGYGFIGGDLYPYFFPQKAFLADPSTWIGGRSRCGQTAF